MPSHKVGRFGDSKTEVEVAKGAAPVGDYNLYLSEVVWQRERGRRESGDVFCEYELAHTNEQAYEETLAVPVLTRGAWHDVTTHFPFHVRGRRLWGTAESPPYCFFRGGRESEGTGKKDGFGADQLFGREGYIAAASPGRGASGVSPLPPGSCRPR